MLLLGLFAVATLLSAYVLLRKRDDQESNVPMVSHCLPFVGHALWFRMDMLGFLEKCRAKYGDIFKIKIFNVKMTVVCDKNLSRDFFKKQEPQMSLFEVLKRLYFDYAFSDDPEVFERNIRLIKKSITVNVDEFMPKIYEEASRMINNVESGILSKQAIKFVTRTSARCFLDIDLSESLFKDIMSFTDRLNQIVVITYMFPKWFIKLIFGFKLRAIRKRITNSMIPIIQNYRIKGGACSLIQNCFDENLNNQEIADVIITLLYVSSENTALGLTASITDIYKNRQFLKKLQVDVAKNINDSKILMKLESLDNAVMESARLNIHVFSLNRQPIAEKYIGNYYIGDTDSVVICGQMVHDAINDVYNPDRHTSISKNASNIMTWGNGVHLCPGKNFALYEIKVALAMWILNYDTMLNKMPSLDYFSPSAFAERRDLTVEIRKHKIDFIRVNKDTYIIKNLIDEPSKLNILRAITPNDTISWDDSKAYPLAYHNNPYTNTSTCEIPEELASICKVVEPTKTWNSMYCNKYGPNSKMAIHKDQYVGIGISISIGASCDFYFDGQTIRLNNGDILVTDFSKYDHGISNVTGTRYSIQMREFIRNENPMSDSEFQQMLLKN